MFFVGRPPLQLPLDDLVLSHLAQLDLFVESLRQQLANQAAAAKAARAEAAAAAAAAAAGHHHHQLNSGRKSRHMTPRSNYLQQANAGQADAAAAAAQVGVTSAWEARYSCVCYPSVQVTVGLSCVLLFTLRACALCV